MRMEGIRAGPDKALSHTDGIHIYVSSCQDKGGLISSGDVINDGCFPGLPGAPPYTQQPTVLSERNVMTNKRILGIGVISLGWMGRLHARSYRAIAERFPELGVVPRLVAAADPVDQVRQEAVDNLGFERAYADYRELLADPEVEAVSICAPNFLHHEMALEAVKAGKPFWIEKPMGVSAAQSREIAQAAEKADLVTAVGFNYRHTPAIEYLRSLARGGERGPPTDDGGHDREESADRRGHPRALEQRSNHTEGSAEGSPQCDVQARLEGLNGKVPGQQRHPVTQGGHHHHEDDGAQGRDGILLTRAVQAYREPGPDRARPQHRERQRHDTSDKPAERLKPLGTPQREPDG